MTCLNRNQTFEDKAGIFIPAQGSLQVRRSISRVRGQGFVEQEPKSAKSRRMVILTPLAIAALERHRTRQVGERLLASSEWQDLGLVFTNAVGRPLDGTHLLRRSFYPLLEKANLPHIRFHDLRHTAATLLLSLGAHPKVVSELLGHSQIGITLDVYSHVMPTVQKDAVSQLNALLEGDF